MTDLEELGRDLKAELTERITPGPPALDRVVRGARRRVRTRKLVAALAGVVLVASIVGVAVGRGPHRSDRISIVTTPTTSTRPTTATTRPADEHLTGDTWVLDLVRRSGSAWTTISGVIDAQGADAPLRFAVEKNGAWYWELGKEVSGVYSGTVVTVDGYRRTIGVGPFVRRPPDRPTSTDTVNELVAPAFVLDASVETHASSVRVLGSERVAGRAAWRAEIRFPADTDLGPTWTWWIDKQTGIVLRSTTRGGTKGFASVKIDGALPTFPDPIVPKGYPVDAVLAAGRPFHELVPRDEPLTTLLSQLAARNAP